MGKGGDRGEESRREGQEKRRVEAGWEHVERGISRDHGTKEREREKDLPRYHDQGGEEGAREEAGGVEGGKKMKIRKARMKRALESEGQ